MYPSVHGGLVRRARRLAIACGIIPVAAACLVLVGWALDADPVNGPLQPLRSVIPGIVNMNPMTALGFIAAGTSLLLLLGREGAGRTVGRALTLVPIAIGAIRLALYLTQTNGDGLDALLFHDKVFLVPGHNAIAPNTALNLLLSGAALGLLDTRVASRRVSPALATITIVVAALTVIGYAFGTRQLYGFLRYFPMALHTGLNFVILGAGIHAARPDRGIASLLVADDEGARLTRRLLPVTLLVPLVIGVLRLEGENLGYYGREFGTALFATAIIATFSAIAIFLGRSLQRSDLSRRALEAEAKDARLRAEEAARSKREFVANMSHEIRTPMNGVIGMTSLLMETDLDERQKEYADTIRVSGEHLLVIINDILDLSKMESGKLELDMMAMDLRGTVEEALDLVAHQASAKGLELVYEFERDVPEWIVGDAARLRQILVNLLANAVKFTSKGEVALSVATDGPDKLRFAVRDTGIGVTAEQKERLFQAFAQGDASTTRRFGGTGLGLSISRKLVERMEGDIGVDSVPGEGATFWFTVRAKHAPARATRVPAADLRGMRVLVVDDNPTNRRVVCQLAKSWGMLAEEAPGPHEALALVAHERFPLVILDHQMPDMDGVELAVRLRQMLPESRLIMLTSLGGVPADLPPGLLQAHLTKPVKPSVLLDAIVDSAPGGARHVPERADSPAIALRPLRILVVEDNAINVKLALRTLERLGQRADVAGNGAEAIEAVARQRYDVVLMDIQMPVMDGLDATRSIVARWKDERPRIIGLSAHALAAERERALAAGMDEYLVKPLDRRRLEAALAQVAPPADLELSADRLSSLVEELGAHDAEALIGTFLDEAQRNVDKLAEAARADDRRTVSHIGHTLKSNAALFGAMELSSICRRLEADATEMSKDALVAQAKLAREAFAAVKPALLFEREKLRAARP